MERLSLNIGSSRSIQRRDFLTTALGVMAAGLGAGRARADHEVLHMEGLGPGFFVNLEDVLRSLAGLEELELDITISESDDETLAQLVAAPDEFDFFYSYGNVVPRLPDISVVAPVVPDRLERWSSVLEPLTQSPTVRAPDGGVRAVPMDWGYYALAQRQGTDIELLPYDRLFQGDIMPRLAIWTNVIGVLVAAAAVGIPDPFTMKPEDLENIRLPMSNAKLKGATLTSDLNAIVQLWQSGQIDAAIMPNDWLPKVLADGGTVKLGSGSPKIVWVSGVSLTRRGAERPEVYRLLDGFLSDEVAVRLLAESSRASAVESVYKADDSDLAQRRNRLGLSNPRDILQAPIWEQHVSVELETRIQTLLNEFQ